MKNISESEQKEFCRLIERGEMLNAREIEMRHRIVNECKQVIEIQLIRLYEGKIGVETALKYILKTIGGDK